MFVLQIISGPYKDQAVRLELDRPLTIGRSPSCNIRLDDKHMSSAHAEVSWTAEGFSVFDLSSANGTLVNGSEAEGRTPLRLGDHIQTGSTVFLLKDVDVEIEGDLDLIDTQGSGGILAFDAGKTEVAMRGMIPVGSTQGFSAVQPKSEPKILGDRADRTQMASHVASARLDDAAFSDIATLKQRVEAGGNGAMVLVQWDDRMDPFWSTPVTIGREHSSGVVVEDSAVSLRHAVVDQRDGGFILRDVGSSNGVYVNRQRVVEHRLMDGDIISIGSHTMVVVLGPGCIGLSVQSPTLTGDLPSQDARAIGVVSQPLAKDGNKKKRKKASELVWYATSDLDRGGFRARAAIVALLFGLGLTGWMLYDGDSEILSGRRLAEHHEDPEFVSAAVDQGLDRCTACHVGAGQVSTLKCLDCHPHNRPTPGHVAADLECVACHLEHQGPEFKASASAVFSCAGCHENPHDALVRTRPQIVAAFDIEAPADVDFHVQHDAQDVECLACHAYEGAREDSIRDACGQCHAPDHPAAADCQMCHGGHPDRETPPRYAEVPPSPPSRFALKGLVWTVMLLVLSFLLAAMIPRRRKVTIETAEAEA